MRGEQWYVRDIHGAPGGPSPRARGAGEVCLVLVLVEGTIPACAGSSQPSPPSLKWSWDHPRVRGEQRPSARRTRRRPGPSPRARGAVLHAHPAAGAAGTIPACAGSRLAELARYTEQPLVLNHFRPPHETTRPRPAHSRPQVPGEHQNLARGLESHRSKLGKMLSSATAQTTPGTVFPLVSAGLNALFAGFPSRRPEFSRGARTRGALRVRCLRRLRAPSGAPARADPVPRRRPPSRDRACARTRRVGLFSPGRGRGGGGV